MDTLLFTTNNRNKVKEVEEVLRKNSFPIHVITDQDLTDPPYVLETGATFSANAKLKAHQMVEFNNLPTLADDSGLSTDKLNGAPSIYPTHYGGEVHNGALNNAKLLAELGGVPKEERKATFHTAMVVPWPGKFEGDLVTEGEIRSEILAYLQGKSNFGYDPLFFVPGKGKTFAEITVDEKNTISRRNQALRKLLIELPTWWKEVENK